MKTTNNAQKTEKPIRKTFVVVFSLILISMTASATGFWKQMLVNNTFGKTTILVNEQENKSRELLTFAARVSVAISTEATSATNAFYIEPAKEKSLEIENWMTDETYFGSNVLADQISMEESKEIENWMLENPYFEEPVITTESEPALEVEAWMTDDSIWEK
jgi:hypothetical protein